MVRPITNWWPMMRMAWRIAVRTTGSPMRPTTRAIAPCGAATSFAIEPDDAAGEHQPPGGGVDEQRLAVAEVARPVAGLDLVGDQAIGGVVIRNAQQRLGEAHQDHALLRRQVVLAQEGVEPRLRWPAPPARPPRAASQSTALPRTPRRSRAPRRARARTTASSSARKSALIACPVGVWRSAASQNRKLDGVAPPGRIGHGALTRSWCPRILAKRTRRRAPLRSAAASRTAYLVS